MHRTLLSYSIRPFESGGMAVGFSLPKLNFFAVTFVGLQPVQLAACAGISAVLLNCVSKPIVDEAVSAEVAAANAGVELPPDSTLVHQVISTLSQIVQFRFQVSKFLEFLAFVLHSLLLQTD